MSSHPKAVVLLSGGMDSCVTAAIARVTHDIALLHASYGQRTEQRERQSFEAIADYWGVRERLLVRLDHLALIGGSALTDHRIAVPEDGAALGGSTPAADRETKESGTVPGLRGVASQARQSGQARVPVLPVPVTYVPFRNAHLLSVAVSWAEVLQARAVFIGAVAEDSSGYPDCRPEYYDAFQQVVRIGTRPETQIEIITPVISMKKSEIVRRGIELGAPLHLTWSCYQFEDEACRMCDSCRLRLQAFREAGQPDPLPYRVRVER
ncbi:MAG: 7-cyano-7-deazaguanine synthase [Candidatus Acidiferrales bacterium]